MIVRISDIKRLRGDAPKKTHLARYDRAVTQQAKRVLHVSCPDCGAGIYALCAETVS